MMNKPELYKSWEYNGVFDIEEDESKLLVSSEHSHALRIIPTIDTSSLSIRHRVLFNLISNRIINITKDNALKHIESIQHNCLNYACVFIEPRIINDVYIRSIYLDYTVDVLIDVVRRNKYSRLVSKVKVVTLEHIEDVNKGITRKKRCEFIKLMLIELYDIISSIATISSSPQRILTPTLIKRFFDINTMTLKGEILKITDKLIELTLGISTILISLLSVNDE